MRHSGPAQLQQCVGRYSNIDTRLDTSRIDSRINRAPIPSMIGVGVGTVSGSHDCKAATKHAIDLQPITCTHAEIGCKFIAGFYRAVDPSELMTN